MKPEIQKMWADALESGEYQQGTGVLCDGVSYCCLGVLCALYRKATSKGQWIGQGGGLKSFVIDDHTATVSLPYPVMAWAGLDRADPLLSGDMRASHLNDHNTTFSEIASLIRRLPDE